MSLRHLKFFLTYSRAFRTIAYRLSVDLFSPVKSSSKAFTNAKDMK